jgi:hypothetical protein
MTMALTKVFMDEQDEALRFYTEVTWWRNTVLDATCGNLVQLAPLARW